MGDSHIHTNVSHDGISTYMEYIDKALTLCFKHLTFTEHWDSYKKVNSNIKTLDIDAHKKEDLASNFKEAKEILLDVGFDEVAVYRKRKPIFYSIK